MHALPSWRAELERAAREARLAAFLREHERLDPRLATWRVVVDLTWRCGLRCPVCPPVEPGPAAADAALLARLAAEVLPRAADISLGCLREPLLHPALAEALATLVAARRAAGAPAQLVLLTSGAPLDESRTELLAHAGLDSVLVSIDTTHPETYARLRPPARWGRTRRKLRELVRRAAGGGPRIGVQALLTRSTWPWLEDSLGELADLGVSSLHLTQLTQAPPAAGREVVRATEPGFGSLVRRLERLASVARQRSLSLSCPTHAGPAGPEPTPLFGDGQVWDEDTLAEDRPAVCVAPWFRLRIDPRGETFPCNQLWRAEDSWGNLGERGFEEIVNGPRAAGLRRALARGQEPPGGCARCPYRPRAGRGRLAMSGHCV